MQKFNVGDLVNFGERRHDFPYTIIHIHQGVKDDRVWYVCAYKGDIPHIRVEGELSLHTTPKVEGMTLYGAEGVYGPYLVQGLATHKITLNTIDGEPDCASVKMEKL